MRRSWEGAACTDLQRGRACEWLLPNGVGGYASQSLIGVATRAQHSLLMSSTPNGERHSLLAQLEDSVAQQPLSTHQYPNAFWPEGYKRITQISLDPSPTWIFALESHTVAKRVEVASNRNATRVTYYLLSGEPTTLRIKPLFAFRGQHQPRHKKDGVEYSFAFFRSTLNVLPDDEPLPCVLHLGEAEFKAAPDWFFHFVYEREREAELPYEEDLFTPGEISIELSQERPFSFWAIADLSPAPLTPISATPALNLKEKELPLFAGPLLIARQIARRKSLLRLREQLQQSASAFFGLDAEKRPTIFGSLDVNNKELWPSLLALPGLCMATGRTSEGLLILQRMMEASSREGDLLVGAWAASVLASQVQDVASLASILQKKLAAMLTEDDLIERVLRDAALAGLWHWALSWLDPLGAERPKEEHSLLEAISANKDKLSLDKASALWAFATLRPLFIGHEARPTLDLARERWLTPKGLRGDGLIAPWRIGLYCDAYLNAYGDNNNAAREHVEQALLSLSSHIESEGCVGFISESFADDEACAPRGALTFAPSIAEPLRVLERLGIK
jgi:glycogen debranching enzyme